MGGHCQVYRSNSIIMKPQRQQRRLRLSMGLSVSLLRPAGIKDMIELPPGQCWLPELIANRQDRRKGNNLHKLQHPNTTYRLGHKFKSDSARIKSSTCCCLGENSVKKNRRTRVLTKCDQCKRLEKPKKIKQNNSKLGPQSDRQAVEGEGSGG